MGVHKHAEIEIAANDPPESAMLSDWKRSPHA
jgi:hypothetical protein